MLSSFRDIWAVDFEFYAPTGENPEPICMVARELHSGRLIRLRQGEFGPLPPFDTGPDVLFVAYLASAEVGCFLALGWPAPQRILDLFVEFRNYLNGRQGYSFGLLSALSYFGFDALSHVEKSEMRELAMRGGPWTHEEMDALVDYCQTDVDALRDLLPKMEETGCFDGARSLARGRYMAAVARMERTGVPIDVPMLGRLRDGWHGIVDSLIAKIDADYGVFEGRSFREHLFEEYLLRNNIGWPRLESGHLDLKEKTFRDMAKVVPEVSSLRELRYSLGSMRLFDALAVGSDGRNRCLLSPFSSRSSRNQPSNAKFIFGMSVWLRGLISPPPGYAVAYIDWSQQEFGIAAALSGDKNMLAAYRSADPYLAFAKQAGAAPPDATKDTHKEVRDLYKQCILGVQYGMGAEALAMRVGGAPCTGHDLLRAHRRTYRTFWQWDHAMVAKGMLDGLIETVYGWRILTDHESNPRSLGNFPMQAHGAEMLRLACCLATEDGIDVCAPVHDAVMIGGPESQINEIVERMRGHMAAASRHVLVDLELGTDADIIRPGERYSDPRGEIMWRTVQELLGAQLG